MKIVSSRSNQKVADDCTQGDVVQRLDSNEIGMIGPHVTEPGFEDRREFQSFSTGQRVRIAPSIPVTLFPNAELVLEPQPRKEVPEWLTEMWRMINTPDNGKGQSPRIQAMKLLRDEASYNNSLLLAKEVVVSIEKLVGLKR